MTFCQSACKDIHDSILLCVISIREYRAVFDGGSGGFDPPQEVADPPASFAELLWGVDSNPLRTPDSIFLLNQYIYVQLYAAYASIETDVI